MKTFIVRLWVDLRVQAESREEAISIARNHPVDVEAKCGVEEYDTQVSGEAWEKEAPCGS